jgi:hypothetical protein
MDNTVKKKLSVFRKRQTVFVIIYGLINVAVIAGIIAYYRLKDVGRILRTFKIKKNVEVTDNGKIII